MLRRNRMSYRVIWVTITLFTPHWIFPMLKNPSMTTRILPLTRTEQAFGVERFLSYESELSPSPSVLPALSSSLPRSMRNGSIRVCLLTLSQCSSVLCVDQREELRIFKCDVSTYRTKSSNFVTKEMLHMSPLWHFVNSSDIQRCPEIMRFLQSTFRLWCSVFNSEVGDCYVQLVQ